MQLESLPLKIFKIKWDFKQDHTTPWESQPITEQVLWLVDYHNETQNKTEEQIELESQTLHDHHYLTKPITKNVHFMLIPEMGQ